MAKNKGKRSAGAESASGNGATAGNDPASVSGETLPSLDESALASLTQKIEQKLQSGSGASKDSQKKQNDSASSAKKKSKEKSKDSAQKPEGEQKANQGKKRNRNGDVIAREEKDGKNNKPSNSKPQGDSKDDVLRREILALGGSKEDFDLLADVDSGSEVENSANGTKGVKGQPDEDSLRKELRKLLKGAGQIKLGDIGEEELEKEEDDDDSEDEDDNGGVEVEDSVSTAKKTPPPPPSKKATKDKNKNKNKDKDKDKDTSKQESSAKKEKDVGQKQGEPMPKEYSKLTIPPRSDWFNTPLPTISTPKVTTGLPTYLLERIRQLAMSFLEKENQMYNQIQQTSSSSSHKFYSTIMTSGTLNDKISALTLAVQESPIHNIKALENLIGLSKKRSRAQAVEVLRSLKDMFSQGTLLPSDRKLKTFANQPSLVAAFQSVGSKWTERDPLPGELQPCHLIVWAFEDYLKEQYFEVLKVLETWCNDEIEFSRSRAVTYVYELLKEKPEQEANLLRLLVNKLGDRGRKIASRASYLLLQLEQAHPLMKSTIITAVEEFIFRPGQTLHAKYYAVITLNQTILSSKEEKVAVQLLDIYFSLFVTLLKPAKSENAERNSKKHPKFGKGKKKKDAKAAKTKAGDQDDQLREKLISAVLTGVNRAYPFTSSDTERLTKHIDTLFRITHSSNFNTSIQALMLIQQLTAAHQVSADRFYRTLYESLLDPRVATSSKQALYLNLLYKSLKNDMNVKRVKAFVKRIVQVLGLHQPSFICGVFFLIRELEKTFPALQSLVDQPEEDESDEEEVFRDVPDEEDGQQQVEATKTAEETQSGKQSNRYDPRKRDPQHSNADKSCLWELIPYLTHFHPSVSVSASHILSHEPLSGKPDLTLHTLTHFLDRFVYRNPKASAPLRGSSLMQPLAGAENQNLLVASGSMSGKGRTQEPVNSEAFWRKRAEEVAAEDVFFHEYFNRLGKDKKSKKEKKAAKDPVARDEEAGESDNESEIWKALVESRPELEADEDNDDDLDMDDLESAFSDEDGEDGEQEDGDVIFNEESDEKSEEGEEGEEDSDTGATEKAKGQSSDEDEDGDAFDMDVSDDEAFRDSDEELPSDLDVQTAEKEDKGGRKKRRKLKHLPTFASVDDYAALLANEDDGM
ncbi:hypothetical protein VTN77DRAFT_4380 [Rasamsonia byssochlamydoides]|uniref:uncharacterized protein n=1 Tax=Rasamsonia byssochlamydoides TaxID=89139 RepID=UPI003743429E